MTLAVASMGWPDAVTLSVFFVSVAYIIRRLTP